MTRSNRALVLGFLAALGLVVWLTGRRPAGPVWPPAALARGNLLLVTIDTLRADRLQVSVMPRLTQLALSGHRYHTAYTHAPLTLPAHASILTGLLPPTHGARGNGAFRLDATQLTLAERLRSSGYRTGAFVGAFVLDSRFGLDQGFDRYAGVDDDRAFAADFGFAERRAPEVLAGATRWILEVADPARPWFAWVHLFDPHAPYSAPGAVGPDPYDDEVRFVDRALAEFLDHLKQTGALARTLVIVTADHGESLGEHGESTHGLFAYDATMRVPLVITGPGLGSADHLAPVAHIDLVPTVLDVLGLPPDSALPGRSLRLAEDSSGQRAIYLEAIDGWLSAGAAPLTAVVQNGWKFVEAPQPELYDLVSDPREARNLVGGASAHQHELEQALRGFESQPVSASVARRDPEAEARLRSLGYVSSGPRKRDRPFVDADDPKQVLPMYERFFTLLASGGHDVAGLRAIVEERPSFDAARLAAASILIETGRAPEAVSLLEAVATPSAAPLALRERLGAAYLASGRVDRAATLLKAVVNEPDASAEAWNELGTARAQGGHLTEARNAFDEAVRLAPHAARIRMNRALAALEVGDRTGARADVSVVTTEHPMFLDGWRLLATLRHKDGDKAGAVEAWRRVLAISASDVDTLFNLAITLRELGQIDQAREFAGRFAAVAHRPAYDRELALLAPLIRP